MRAVITIMLVVGVASTAAAVDLGNQAPVKAPGTYPESVLGPLFQGGEDIASATLIPSLPYSDSGTTAGHIDDYDYACPYTGSTSPDVVYRFVATADYAVDIDLCYSGYDTKVYVYQKGATNPIACNDDFYFSAPCYTYSSFLGDVAMTTGNTYDIVVDGYGGSSGDYVLDVTGAIYVPCVLPCPSSAYLEGEPALVEDYVDEYNGGCQASQNGWQHLPGDAAGALTLCGASGWYLFYGDDYRDTDWYLLTMGAGGSIEITGDAEYASDLYELGPQDCAAVGILQQTTVGPCAESSMTIAGYAQGAPVWFWVGPTAYSDPDGGANEYDYVLRFSGLESSVAADSITWSTVKALYE